MYSGQSGIFAVGTASHAYLEFDLRPGGGPLQAAQILSSLLIEPTPAVSGVNIVTGFRPEMWRGIAPDQIPANVVGFNQPLQGAEGFTMAATQHDLFVWIAGVAYDKVYDAVRETTCRLDEAALLADETDGFVYQGNRDLIGFIDGTENPPLVETPEVVLVPEGQPGAGGSILLVQKWIHDAKAWEALPDSEQEMAVGRTKADSVQLPLLVRGPHAHVTRMVVTENGEELRIFRRNTNFGTPASHGTMFIGFAAKQHNLARMLRRMAGAEGGIRDALTYYAAAVTGSYYFVPSVQALRGLVPEES